MTDLSPPLLEARTESRWIDRLAPLVVVGCIAGMIGVSAVVGDVRESTPPGPSVVHEAR